MNFFFALFFPFIYRTKLFQKVTYVCIMCVSLPVCLPTYLPIYLVVLTDRCKHISYASVLIVSPIIPFLTSGSLFKFSPKSFRHEPNCPVQYDFLIYLLCIFPALFFKKPYIYLCMYLFTCILKKPYILLAVSDVV